MCFYFGIESQTKHCNEYLLKTRKSRKLISISKIQKLIFFSSFGDNRHQYKFYFRLYSVFTVAGILIFKFMPGVSVSSNKIVNFWTLLNDLKWTRPFLSYNYLRKLTTTYVRCRYKIVNIEILALLNSVWKKIKKK